MDEEAKIDQFVQVEIESDEKPAKKENELNPETIKTGVKLSQDQLKIMNKAR